MLSVLIGAATQRVTGFGFALVSAPLLVLTSGPVAGVLLTNLLSLITCAVVLTQTWRQIDLKRVALLAVPALCCEPLGQWVTHRLSPPALMVGIGGLLLAALAALRLLRRTAVFAGRGGAVAAGALSGFMNVTAGAGGPATTLYVIGSRWPHRSLVGSMQLHFALLNVGSIVVKGLPQIGPAALAAVVAALGLGVAAGQVMAHRIAPERARAAVLVLAVAGAAGTVVKGVVMWLG